MPDSGNSHATLARFPVGARVYALADTAVCSAQEPGVVYDAYQFGSHQGRSVIFEKGGNDGFSAVERDRFLAPEGSVDPSIALYRFKNVGALQRDHSRGAFSFRFPRSFAQLEADALAACAPSSIRAALPPRV